MLKTITSGACLVIATSAFAADNCESIRAGIDAKIRASGVARYTVIVVDNGAAATGRVVGTCDHGAKRILYSQPAATAGSAVALRPFPKPRQLANRGSGAVLTECKDGSVSHDGKCRD